MMFASRLFCAAAATLLLASGAAAEKSATAQAMLKTPDGTPAGVVRFADTPEGLEIGVEGLQAASDRATARARSAVRAGVFMATMTHDQDDNAFKP